LKKQPRGENPEDSKPGPNFRVKNKGGAPKGNRNAFKSGAYTAENLAVRRAMRRGARQMILRIRATIAQARLLMVAPNVTTARTTPSPHRPNN
jgi:uncharacterized protein YjcR